MLKHREGGATMATNLALDDKLIEEARTIGKHKTKKDAVTAALMEYVQHRKRQGILDMIGKVEYWDDYDHKILRREKRP
jgi:Arc/MetJ family transcription regulator